MFAGASPYNSEAAGAATALAGVRVRGGFRIACRYQDGATRVSDLDESGGWRIRFPELHHTRHIEAVSINTGGGIIGGDHIACQIAADSGHLVVASQAAERIYRSLGPPARITSTFTLGGFPAAFEAPLDLSITNSNGITSTYYVYRSTNLLTEIGRAHV